jgi:hypothetical protein
VVTVEYRKVDNWWWAYVRNDNDWVTNAARARTRSLAHRRLLDQFVEAERLRDLLLDGASDDS